MSTLNISLPDAMRAFIEEQVGKGGYSTASEYVRDLVREAQRRDAQQRLEALLLEGLSSEASELTADDWEEIRRAALQRLTTRKSG